MAVTTPSRTGSSIGAASGRMAKETWWYNWVNRNRVLGIILTGVIATQLGTYFGYVFPAIGLPTLPWPVFNGILGAPASEFGAADSFFVGQNLHFINGIVFAILYAVLFLPLMPFKNTKGGNLLSATLYAVIMTIISVGLLVPYAYVPKQGYGLFLFDGPDGWKLPLSVLIWHLIYGFFLGTLYQVRSDDTAEAA